MANDDWEEVDVTPTGPSAKPEDWVDAGGVPGSTPTGLSKLGDVAQKTASVINTPARGMRAVGVGVENLLKGQNPLAATGMVPPDMSTLMANMVDPNTLDRSVEATKPGFVPQDGEKLGSFAGETLGSMPLATAMGGVPESELVGRGRLIAMLLKENPQVFAQALRNSVAGGAVSAIQQASEKGEVEWDDVALVAGTGGLLPFIRPTAKALGRAVSAYMRNKMAQTSSLSREAAQEWIDNPKIIDEVKGTANTIKRRVQMLQGAIKRRMDEVGTTLADARGKFKIDYNIDDQTDELADQNFASRGINDIIDDASDNITGIRYKKVIPRTVVGKRGGIEPKINPPVKEFDGGLVPEEFQDDLPEPTKINAYDSPTNLRGQKVNFSSINPKDSQIPFEERVRGLYRARKEISKYISWRKNATDLQPLMDDEEARLFLWRKRINGTLDDMAENNKDVKRLRDTDAAYHSTADIYTSLQKKFATTSDGEQILTKIAKGDDLDEILGLTGGTINRIRRVEQETGKKILEPLRKEYMTKIIKESKGTSGFVGPAMEGAGLQNTQKLLQSRAWASSAVQKMLNKLTQPYAKPAIIAGTSSLED